MEEEEEDETLKGGERASEKGARSLVKRHYILEDKRSGKYDIRRRVGYEPMHVKMLRCLKMRIRD